MVILYEGNKRDLFFVKEKEPKGQDTKGIETFRQKDCYQTELWRASIEAPKGQFLSFRKSLTESTFKKSYFLIL